ncbi:MAG: hypothetical protein WBD71_19820 [Xanthobacteraceae bacterium]
MYLRQWCCQVAGGAMSVLDRFVRIRRFRAQAADNYDLAAGAFSDSVRARYLAVADHYTALAEAELLSDKRERQVRLAEMQAKRAAERAQELQKLAPVAPQPRKLRLIRGDGITTDKRRITLRARSNLAVAGISAKRER